MTIYIPRTKNITTFNPRGKSAMGAGNPFYAWLFMFTTPGTVETSYTPRTRNITTHVNRIKN